MLADGDPDTALSVLHKAADAYLAAADPASAPAAGDDGDGDLRSWAGAAAESPSAGTRSWAVGRLVGRLKAAEAEAAALRAALAELAAALGPFAEYATARDAADRSFRTSGPHDDSRHIVEWGSVAHGTKSYTITLGDCRRAAAALARHAGRADGGPG